MIESRKNPELGRVLRQCTAVAGLVIAGLLVRGTEVAAAQGVIDLCQSERLTCYVDGDEFHVEGLRDPHGAGWAVVYAAGTDSGEDSCGDENGGVIGDDLVNGVAEHKDGEVVFRKPGSGVEICRVAVDAVAAILDGFAASGEEEPVVGTQAEVGSSVDGVEEQVDPVAEGYEEPVWSAGEFDVEGAGERWGASFAKELAKLGLYGAIAIVLAAGVGLFAVVRGGNRNSGGESGRHTHVGKKTTSRYGGVMTGRATRIPTPGSGYVPSFPPGYGENVTGPFFPKVGGGKRRNRQDGPVGEEPWYVRAARGEE